MSTAWPMPTQADFRSPWRCGKCGLAQPDSYDSDCDKCGGSLAQVGRPMTDEEIREWREATAFERAVGTVGPFLQDGGWVADYEECEWAAGLDGDTDILWWQIEVNGGDPIFTGYLHADGKIEGPY